MRNDITVVITHYNIPTDLMKKCIDSVVEQGLKYIIVDDCSESDSRESLSCYENVHVLPENVGPFHAFQVGLDKVRTRYVMRVDADDYITGCPDTSTNEDAYINNIFNKISLDPVEFRKVPYAGMNGAAVKTRIMRAIWQPKEGLMQDVVMFHRLILNYKPVMNETCYYKYVIGREGSITDSRDKDGSSVALRDMRVREMKAEAKKHAESIRYGTYDRQDMQFRDYTFQEPETEEYIRRHFWGYDEARTSDFDYFTMEYIAEVWDVEFVEEGTDRFLELKNG